MEGIKSRERMEGPLYKQSAWRKQWNARWFSLTTASEAGHHGDTKEGKSGGGCSRFSYHLLKADSTAGKPPRDTIDFPARISSVTGPVQTIIGPLFVFRIDTLSSQGRGRHLGWNLGCPWREEAERWARALRERSSQSRKSGVLKGRKNEHGGAKEEKERKWRKSGASSGGLYNGEESDGSQERQEKHVHNQTHGTEYERRRRAQTIGVTDTSFTSSAPPHSEPSEDRGFLTTTDTSTTTSSASSTRRRSSIISTIVSAMSGFRRRRGESEGAMSAKDVPTQVRSVLCFFFRPSFVLRLCVGRKA